MKMHDYNFFILGRKILLKVGPIHYHKYLLYLRPIVMNKCSERPYRTSRQPIRAFCQNKIFETYPLLTGGVSKQSWRVLKFCFWHSDHSDHDKKERVHLKNFVCPTASIYLIYMGLIINFQFSKTLLFHNIRPHITF